jgi:hypothetical protein
MLIFSTFPFSRLEYEVQRCPQTTRRTSIQELTMMLMLYRFICLAFFVSVGHIYMREDCRHPKDRVPPYTTSKSRQGAGRASTRCHVSCTFGPHLLVKVGSGTVTCPTAPDLASLLRRAPLPPRVPQLQTSPPCWGELRALPRVPRPRILPPCWGELRRCHVSLSSGPCLLDEVSSGAVTCPTAPSSAFLRGARHSCPWHAARLPLTRS